MTSPSEPAASARPTGRVSLVGAGPGDPELWTMRAVRRLVEADLVLYDALVDPRTLREYTRGQCFCVGKRAGGRSVRQDTIHRLMIRAARAGKTVVRLKGGDPFVFGRGAEEALALIEAGIAVDVVPGVSSAVAAPALAGIPVTHRGATSGFVVVSGHQPEVYDQVLSTVGANAVTLVVMMGLSTRQALVGCLAARGWRADMPAAIVCDAGTPRQWTWTGTLADVADVVVPGGAAGVVVVGEVVRVRGELAAESGAAVGETDGREVRYGRNR